LVVAEKEKWGEGLKAFRESLYLTQRELAGKVGLSPEAYAKMEARGSRPRDKAVIASLHGMGYRADAALPPVPLNYMEVKVPYVGAIYCGMRTDWTPSRLEWSERGASLQRKWRAIL
jgi:transcriptional regulator with XRE-family HTH domain